jgi:hypothetical protein
LAKATGSLLPVYYHTSQHCGKLGGNLRSKGRIKYP